MHPKPSGCLLRNGRRIYLVIAMAPMLVAFVAAWFVAAIDPYDLRPWGARDLLTGESYPGRIRFRLVDAVARNGTTHAIVGGSTVQRIRPEMLRAAFGPNSKPFNLSFGGVRPADLAIVLTRLLESKSIKHVIATIDGTMLASSKTHSLAFPKKYYEISWWNIAPDFEPRTVRDVLNIALTGRLSYLVNGKEAFERDRVPIPLQPKKYALLRQDVESTRAFVTSPTTRTCESIEPVSKVYFPIAHEYSKRGIQLDLLIPPYALASYAERAAGAARAEKRRPGSLPPAGFAELQKLRECIVNAVANIENVRVHGFDNDQDITADLMNYGDTRHVQSEATYRKIIQSIANGRNVLTPKNWPEYAAILEQRVMTLQLDPDPKKAPTFVPYLK
jgi:hypothetical protein